MMQLLARLIVSAKVDKLKLAKLEPWSLSY